MAAQLPDELRERIYRWRNESIMIDAYNASGTLAGGLAALTAPLAGTGVLSFIPAFFIAYTGLAETLDAVTAPMTGLLIAGRYGEGALGVLEGILEALPFTDIVPGVSLAHNIYLDRLKEQGYSVPDDMYVMPQAYLPISHVIRDIIGGNNVRALQPVTV